MVDRIGHYVDLLVQQGDLLQLIAFYKSDSASKNYINQNLPKISRELGFHKVRSFRELVEAYDRAKIDTIIARKGQESLENPAYLETVMKSTSESLSYAFGTKNLDNIKYALIMNQPAFVDVEWFYDKVVGPLLNEYYKDFLQYPVLESKLREVIDAIRKADKKRTRSKYKCED